MQSLIREPFYHAWTFFLFTKSDIKTTLIPIVRRVDTFVQPASTSHEFIPLTMSLNMNLQSIFAFASAPIASASRIPHVVFWVWLHLLQFDVSNQLMDPDEDKHNKPDRPLPANRISYEHATILRWVLVPLCWILSAAYSPSVLCASVALVAFTVIYDELHAHSSHFAVRNLVNAAGFASFETGSTLIAGMYMAHHSGVILAGPNVLLIGNDASQVTSTMILAVSLSAGIFATTIQAQDFKDVRGDSLIGRKTLPIVLPSLARPTLSIALLAWSLSLSYIWRLDVITASALIMLSCIVGSRFVFIQDEKRDQISFYWYNVRLTFYFVVDNRSRRVLC